MSQRVYDADQLALQGAVHVLIAGAKKGDTVIAVVEGTIRAFEDKSPAHQGNTIVAKARTGEALMLSDAEAQDFRERLADQRRVREDAISESQGQLADGDDYDRMSGKDLKEMAKERGLNPSGTKAELAQRLRDNT